MARVVRTAKPKPRNDIDDIELHGKFYAGTEARLCQRQLRKGEETDSVPVYDTCDDIRRQITAYLKKPGITQAQFGRDLLKQFHTDRAPKGISGSQMQAFRGKKGPDAGNTSSVFYGAYVFFEKMRIKQNKPKSEKRKEMEEVWGPGGFDIEHNSATTGLVLSPFLSCSFPCFQSSLPFVSYACLLSSYISTTKDSLRNGRHCHKRQIRKDALLQAS